MNILDALTRPLAPTDIDFRVYYVNRGGYATIVPSKKDTADMERLRRVCGTHWQKDYKTINGYLYCGIGIKIENEWLWRWGAGDGDTSEAFKSAGLCWGIGQELHSYPPIKIKLKADEFTVFNEENGTDTPATDEPYNLRLNWNWQVSFDAEDRVSRLMATDAQGVTRYTYERAKAASLQPEDIKDHTADGERPRLEKRDKEGNFTNAWLTVVNAIGEGKVTSVEQVKNHFKVSNTTLGELQTVLDRNAIAL